MVFTVQFIIRRQFTLYTACGIYRAIHHQEAVYCINSIWYLPCNLSSGGSLLYIQRMVFTVQFIIRRQFTVYTAYGIYHAIHNEEAVYCIYSIWYLPFNSTSGGSLLYMQHTVFTMHPRWLAAKTIRVEHIQ
jgi:hypothetical protein